MCEIVVYDCCPRLGKNLGNEYIRQVWRVLCTTELKKAIVITDECNLSGGYSHSVSA